MNASATINDPEVQAALARYKQKRADEEARRQAESATTVDEALEGTLARLNRLAEASRIFTEDHRKWGATKPQTILCELHHVVREINWDKSVTRSHAEDAMILVYKLCPKCVEAKKTMANSGWLKRMGIHDTHLHCSFDNYVCDTEEDKENLSVAQSFCRSRKGFLVMLGPKRGNGKTHLSVAILRELQKGFFIEGPDLFDRLHGGFDRRERIVSRCKETPVLVVDEFGLSHGYDDELAHTHNIFSHRFGEKLRVVITGNFENKHEFYKVIGDRMADRLTESGFKICWFTGDSRRSKMKQQYFLDENEGATKDAK